MRTSRARSFFYACAFVVGTASAQIRIKPLLELDSETSDGSLSPDGKTLVFEWCKPDYSCDVYTRPVAGGSARFLAGRDREEGVLTSPRWSPDGKKIAFTRVYAHFDNRLFIRDLGHGSEKHLGTICDSALESSWSPDGRFLVASVYISAALSECRPELFSAETGKRVRRLAPKGGASAFSPDGRKLAYADGSTLKLVRLTDYLPNEPPTTIAREPREISAVHWTPDGKQIIYETSGDVSYLRRLKLGPGARPQTIPGLSDTLSITQLLSGGRALATETTRVEALWRADLKSTPPKIETVEDSGCFYGAPGCSPDGRARVFITTRTGISEIWVANADGTNERPLVRAIPGFTNPVDDGAPSLIGYSPDGKWVAFTTFPRHGNADVRSYLYVVPSSGGNVRRLAKDAYALDFPTWAPDSKALYGSQGWPVNDQAHGLESPQVRVDISDGKIVGLGADGMWPRVSHDGRFLYFFTTPYPELCRIPIAGGAEEHFLTQAKLWWVSVAIGSRYLYLFEEPKQGKGAGKIIRFEPETKKSVALADISFSPQSAFLSPDEHYLYFSQEGDPKERVVMVEGLF